MSTFTQIRWLRVIIGAVLVEVALFAIVVALNFLPNGASMLPYVVAPACVLTTFAGGWWAARAAPRHFVLNGLLVGALAALLYAILTWKTTLPAVYVISNWLKLAGGAAGGFVAGRLSARARLAPQDA
jgi:putative membrane protein (TIGR04086 family)